MAGRRGKKGLVKAGDVPMVADLARKNLPSASREITSAEHKLLEGIMDIRDKPSPDKADMAFMARQLLQCTLPHTDPLRRPTTKLGASVPTGSGAFTTELGASIPRMEVWVRKNGSMILGIQPGVNLKTQKSYGYPYGSLPRLLLFWMVTEAVKTKSRTLKLGNSFSEFMVEIGLTSKSDTGRSKRSTARRLRDQIDRLLSAQISFQQYLEDGAGGAGDLWLNMPVAPNRELWWNPRSPGQKTLWVSQIELGEKFFQAIIVSPVPLDMRAIKGLRKSPLALDLYSLCTYRAFVASTQKKDQTIPWLGLELQLGADYGTPKDFRKKITQKLLKVKAVYPGLRYKVDVKGITILSSSQPAVAAVAEDSSGAVEKS